MKEEYEVIVVGAGPAGGQCARNLAQKGIDVLLVERYPTFHDNNFSSAGMSLEGFNEFNLPENVIGRYWKNFTLQTSNEIAAWKGTSNKGVVLDFAKFRQFLSDDCIKYGGDVLMGYSYESKELKDDGVIAFFKSKKENKELSIKAKLLVDATGPARKVIYDDLSDQPKMEKSVGIEYLIEVNDEVYNKFKDDLFFFLGEKWCYKGYSWIFPMNDNMLKVGTAKMLSEKWGKNSESLKETTERIISDYMNAPDRKVVDVHGGMVRLTKNISEAFYQNNVVGIGDAISAINPLGGEGIRYALRSANDVTPYIIDFVKNDKETFRKYRKNWRRKYLFTWKLCSFLAETVYDKYPEKKLELKIKKYKDKISIDQLIDILFEFKFTKMKKRLLSYGWSRIKGKFKRKVV